MPTTLVEPPLTGTRRYDFAVELGAEPDALVRVLVLLRRRGCRIARVDFAAGDRMEVTVLAPDRIAHRLESLLLNLVDVLAVRAEPDPVAAQMAQRLAGTPTP
jgi:acetolactate synthase regulatory subunit